ncbi:hypothetical protein Tco_0228911 [Tanacetum coccineum]
MDRDSWQLSLLWMLGHVVRIALRNHKTDHMKLYLLFGCEEPCIWKAFGGNTRDLGSFGEETDKTTDLHQHLSRISTQKLETASQITRDAVTTHLKTASQDLQTASEEWWNQIEEYVQYQDDLWDEPSPSMNVSSILEAIQPTLRGRLKRACNRISFLETPTREVCLSGGDIYNDHSLLRFYQNDNTSPWGNNKHKEKGEDGPEWIIRKGPEGSEQSIIQESTPQPSILYQPAKSSNLPFPSKLKKQKKDDEDERLLSIFKQIHINLPFLEPMIHILKGAKVLKDLLSHKEKLEKAASLVKLSEECSVIIQRSLPQKEGDPGSLILPCLIGPLAVKNALADLGASINLMPHSLFR